MAQLYRGKWEHSEGQILDHKNNYTSGFLLWCRKTEGITDEEWRRGFYALEDELRQAARTGEGKEIWPPSYPAFIEKCKSGVNLSLYKPFPRQIGIEDKTAKEHRYAVGQKACSELLNLFD